MGLRNEIWKRYYKEGFREFFRIATGFERPYPFQLDVAEKILTMSKGVLLLKAETGSGKTEAVVIPSLYKGTICIIVEPYRAIIEDLEERILKYLQNLSERFDIPYRLGVDYGEFHEIYEVREGTIAKVQRTYTPLGVDVLLTTIDEFVHRLLSAIGKRKASVLASIYLSSSPVTFFDEAHSYVSGGSYNLFLSLIHTLSSVAEYGLAVVSSATLPEALKKHLEKVIIGSKSRVEAPPRPKKIDKMVLVSLSTKNIVVETLRILEKHRENATILVRTITPEEAYSVYQRLLQEESLRDVYLGILHGRMALEDRREVFKAVKDILKQGERLVLVATGTIEAGVNFDFNFCVTRLIPYPHLEQTLGRVNRHYLKQNLIVIVDTDDKTLRRVYRLPRDYMEELRNVLTKFEGRIIEWNSISPLLREIDEKYVKESLDYGSLVDMYSSSFSKLLAVSYASLFHMKSTLEEYLIGLLTIRYNVREAENIQYRIDLSGQKRTFRLPFWVFQKLEEVGVKQAVKEHHLIRITLKRDLRPYRKAYGIVFSS